MTMDELENRIQRIYAAIGATIEHDMTKLPGRTIATDKVIGMVQDFSGGRSRAEIENLAQAVIANIASLRDHLCKWARVNGHDSKVVCAFMKRSEPLQIITDLWNNDKHGYRSTGGCWFKDKYPHVQNVRTRMQLSTRAANTTTLQGLKKHYAAGRCCLSGSRYLKGESAWTLKRF